MKNQILKLASIAAAPSRLIIGLMSGTSLDGLDIACCKFTGSGVDTQVKVLHFKTVPYTQEFKELLKAISFKSQVDLQQVTILNALIGSNSALMIMDALAEWGISPTEVDLIASHGQTIYHAPYAQHPDPEKPSLHATLQIGDGDHIAVGTGIITLSDFRQKHIAAGGQGAPLAIYGDYLLFSDPQENRVLLNIGGISNFTFLPKGQNPDQVFSTDVGPGNTLMDQFIQLHYPNQYYDKDALIAKAGKTNTELLDILMSDAFLQLPFPKSTGPELFNMQYLDKALSAIYQKPSNEDIMATLCEFSAAAIIKGITASVGTGSFQVYLSGGGLHNPLLVEKISHGLQLQLKNTSDLGISPDAKEAVLFAVLANECIAGGNTDYGKDTGSPSVTMGKISLP